MNYPEKGTKQALKKLTKSEKRRGATLREEIAWLEKTKAWPFYSANDTPKEAKTRNKIRLLHIIDLKIKLSEIYGEGNRQK